jgi:hypothetical protein
VRDPADQCSSAAMHGIQSFRQRIYRNDRIDW